MVSVVSVFCKKYFLLNLLPAEIIIIRYKGCIVIAIYVFHQVLNMFLFLKTFDMKIYFVSPETISWEKPLREVRKRYASESGVGAHNFFFTCFKVLNT